MPRGTGRAGEVAWPEGWRKAQSPWWPWPRVSKRQQLRPAPAKGRARWDRKRIVITLVALVIVVTMVGSGFLVLFYGGQ